MRFTPYSITTFNDAIAIKAAVEEKNGKMEHMKNRPHCWRVQIQKHCYDRLTHGFRSSLASVKKNNAFQNSAHCTT